MLAGLIMLLGCAPAAEQDRVRRAREDAQGLHDALAAARTDLDRAAELCLALHAPERRDLCLVTLLQVEPPADLARQLCPRIQDPLWAEECAFQVIELELDRLDPVEATRRCYTEAPRFGRHCMGHAEAAWTEQGAPAWFHADHLEAQLQALAEVVPQQDRQRIDKLRPRARAVASPSGSPLQGERWWPHSSP